MTPIRAQMARDSVDGNWHLYVAITPGRVAEWPRYDWPKSRRSIPTVGERDKVLKSLGFRRDAGVWDWQEHESGSRRVELFASVDVAPE